jgi:hypothetical protein
MAVSEVRLRKRLMIWFQGIVVIPKQIPFSGVAEGFGLQGWVLQLGSPPHLLPCQLRVNRSSLFKET